VPKPIQAYLGYCVLPSNYGLLPQDASLRERIEKSFWTSLAWWRRLHDSHLCTVRCLAAHRCLLCGWTTPLIGCLHVRQRSHRFGGGVSGGVLREACDWQKPPGIHAKTMFHILWSFSENWIQRNIIEAVDTVRIWTDKNCSSTQYCVVHSQTIW
jgi:hypothetical protein